MLAVCTCVSFGLLLQLFLTLSPRSLHLPVKLTVRKLSVNLLRRQRIKMTGSVGSVSKRAASDWRSDAARDRLLLIN